MIEGELSKFPITLSLDKSYNVYWEILIYTHPSWNDEKFVCFYQNESTDETIEKQDRQRTSERFKALQ